MNGKGKRCIPSLDAPKRADRNVRAPGSMPVIALQSYSVAPTPDGKSISLILRGHGAVGFDFTVSTAMSSRLNAELMLAGEAASRLRRKRPS